MSILKVPVDVEDHIQGDKRAPITLVEYGDYECPFCGKAYYFVKQIEKHFGKQLCFIFRNFPLKELHPHAEAAAEAAEFAADHKKFWEMHDLIFENQENLSIPTLLELGQDLELSTEDLDEAIVNKKYESKISKDFMGGVRSGVNGTPTFYINDQKYVGPFEELIHAIDAVLVK